MDFSAVSFPLYNICNLSPYASLGGRKHLNSFDVVRILFWKRQLFPPSWFMDGLEKAYL